MAVATLSRQALVAAAPRLPFTAAVPMISVCESQLRGPSPSEPRGVAVCGGEARCGAQAGSALRTRSPPGCGGTSAGLLGALRHSRAPASASSATPHASGTRARSG
jgi:hypothetical protein